MLLAATIFALTAPIVMDGDSFKDTAPWGRQPFRIPGIAAPEKGQEGAPEATAALTTLLAPIGPTAPLACTMVARPSFDRLVTACTLPDGRDLACALHATGTVAIDRRYAPFPSPLDAPECQPAPAQED